MGFKWSPSNSSPIITTMESVAASGTVTVTPSDELTEVISVQVTSNLPDWILVNGEVTLTTKLKDSPFSYQVTSTDANNKIHTSNDFSSVPDQQSTFKYQRMDTGTLIIPVTVRATGITYQDTTKLISTPISEDKTYQVKILADYSIGANALTTLITRQNQHESHAI